MAAIVGGILFSCCIVAIVVTHSSQNARLVSEQNARLSLPPGDMTLKEFILQKPDGPVAVQVDCELTTYYNYAFRQCAQTHYSFRVQSRSPTFADAHVYAPKNSEYGRSLYELLKAGNKRRFTLRIQRLGPYGESLPARDDGCFALVGVVDAQ
jgi:hypothetical protein